MLYLQPSQGIRTRLYLPTDIPEYTFDYCFMSIPRETCGYRSTDGAPLHSTQHISYLLLPDQSLVSVPMVGKCHDNNVITRQIGTCSKSERNTFGEKR